jgi:hypothetical protein
LQDIQHVAMNGRGRQGKRKGKQGGKGSKRSKTDVLSSAFGGDSETESESDDDGNGDLKAWQRVCGSANHGSGFAVPTEWADIFENMDQQLTDASKGGQDPMLVATLALTALKTIVMSAHRHTQGVINGAKERVQGMAACDAGLFVNGLAAPVASLLVQRIQAHKKAGGFKKAHLRVQDGELTRVAADIESVVKPAMGCQRCMKQTGSKNRSDNHALHTCLQILPAHLGVKKVSGEDHKGGMRGKSTGGKFN